MRRWSCRSRLAHHRSLTLLLLLILKTIASARSHELIRFPWGFRGGSVELASSQQQQQHETHVKQFANNQRRFLSIGVVQLDDGKNDEWRNLTKLPSWFTETRGNDAICALHSPTETRPSILKFKIDAINTNAMVESLAITCDVIILVVSRVPTASPSTSCSLPPDTVKALVRGLARRRHQGNLERSTVVVVLMGSSSSNDNELESQAWKDQVSLVDLVSVTPDLVERLELVTSTELGSLWNEFMENDNRLTESFSPDDSDTDMFPVLLQEVYRSLSGDATATVTINVFADSNEAACTVNDKPIVKTSTNTAILVQQVIEEAQHRLEGIETRQEQIWLDDTASPMLEFGSLSEQILNDAQSQLASIDNYSDQQQYQVLLQLAIELRRLYLVQLQALREHYGRRFDTILESTRDERRWAAAAADATERFRVAAQHAIPTLCRQDGLLRDADFNYIPSLHGLISDMTQATSLRQDLETALTEDLEDNNDEDDENGTPSKRRNKWYHKLAARALVLGVNYLQGWLAWKALQKAADERDRAFPKFPLF